MAQITGTVSGLKVASRPDEADDDEGDELTPEQELCRMIVTRLAQDHPKAAASAAVDLVNLIGATHGLACKAFL